jgi:type VI secretion system protein VasG
LERQHSVRLLDEAVQASVRLSKRYIMGRQLPDKAVGLLDSACARVSAAQMAMPPQLEDCQHHIALVEAEIHTLQRENAARGTHEDRLSALFDDLASAETQLADLEDRCREEKRLVTRSIQLQREIEESDDEESRFQKEAADKRAELASIEAQLKTVQGESPLVPAVVDARVLAEIVASQTGIPMGRMLGSEIHNVLNLRNLLAERILGQDHALNVIARRVASARAQIEDPNRPTGVFLLAGPSGVGKTETALALADILYGERNAVVLNMSEYQEAHSVSGLKGAPPGYVGYDEGGVLTESIRRHPYCVLLLDEMEKAHADVIELFYQIFDKGILEDAQGRRVDFRNALILMTSNVGAELIQELCLESEPPPSPEQLTETLGHELRRIFKPAFLSRLIVVPYYPVQHATLRHIVELKVEKLCRRLEKSHKISLRYNETLVEEIARQCVERHGFQKDSGARNIDHVLTGTLIPDISERLLMAMADHRRINEIHVDTGGAKGFRYYIE